MLTLYIQGKFGGETQRYSLASSNSGSSSLDSPESARETSVECKSFEILHLFILFIYFIILPHTMNYKQNKNDNDKDNILSFYANKLLPVIRS